MEYKVTMVYWNGCSAIMTDVESESDWSMRKRDEMQWVLGHMTLVPYGNGKSTWRSKGYRGGTQRLRLFSLVRVVISQSLEQNADGNAKTRTKVDFKMFGCSTEVLKKRTTERDYEQYREMQQSTERAIWWTRREKKRVKESKEIMSWVLEACLMVARARVEAAHASEATVLA